MEVLSKAWALGRRAAQPAPTHAHPGLLDVGHTLVWEGFQGFFDKLWVGILVAGLVFFLLLVKGTNSQVALLPSWSPPGDRSPRWQAGADGPAQVREISAL